ncbi:peptide chain release factor N(5)-glutamine methyltransferase [Dehalobacterium formicoaceticum]|uniref:peptide chain release factor N(5)-glutamine methyltransferase n=1 Tax=Dehalobacterium formicoaceticum TaxID=51515 RepID=UPI0018DF9399|nr:peptide chain release factor N(5)-glutamine methyltransferase [Dehalobacterium formicoaceticum]
MIDKPSLKIAEWLSWGDKMLQEAGLENSRREAELLLAAVLEISFTLLLTRLQEEINPLQGKAFQKLILQRQNLEPLQYLTGVQNFMSLDFEVNEAVLIPRWDTERLVELALEQLKDNSAPLVADVGTGSGAIIVSLAKYLQRGHFFAIDISPEALQVAERNARRHGLAEEITFLIGDLLEPLLTPAGDGRMKFDLVVSNPPYIPIAEIYSLPSDVQKEPHLALAGGEDGLSYYRRILPQVKEILKPGGQVLLEIGWNQGEDVCALCRSNGFVNISVTRDFGGRDRVVSASFRG